MGGGGITAQISDFLHRTTIAVVNFFINWGKKIESKSKFYIFNDFFLVTVCLSVIKILIIIRQCLLSKQIWWNKSMHWKRNKEGSLTFKRINKI